MAMIIKRIATGFFDGHWSLLTTVNGGLAGMVGIRNSHNFF
jgi:ammonia channel protein AmtB